MSELALFLTLLLIQTDADSSETQRVEPASKDGATVLLVVGAAGTDAYGKQFAEWADRWTQAAKTAHARMISIGSDSANDVTDRTRLHDAIQSFAGEKSESDLHEVWIVLIGHGTFDGKQAKFNLRGPDVAASEFKNWLEPVQRPVVVINCASASGPFVSQLNGPDRVVVAATRSGHEQNFSRFGDYFSQTISDPSADLDKDGQTSLLEAFLSASRRTEEFYRTDGRLVTEHALLEDNGDGLAVRFTAFHGIRPAAQSVAGSSEGGARSRPVAQSGSVISLAGRTESIGDRSAVDGIRAHQFHLLRSPADQQLPAELRRRRDSLELEVIQLRDRKAEFAEEAYYDQLELLLSQLAESYEAVDNQ